MKFQHFQPVDLLKPFIKTILVIESGEGLQNNILPDTSLTMAFKLRGTITNEAQSNINFPSSFIAGIRKSTLTVNYFKDTLNLLISFREGAAASFFKTPLHEFAGMPLPLNNLVHASDIRDVEEQLCEAVSNTERIAIVEKWLLSRIQFEKDGLVQEAIRKIRSAAGDIRIKELVSALPISRDPFEKKFRRIVGTSPKQFASIVRLRHLIDHYSDEYTFTDAAHRAGYFDQAHFIKDFQSFTGKSPKAYFASQPKW
jgi:AraC-like DNA-binding protein